MDDALIPARIASHVHEGLGHRFNIGGPVVDAVTPFGWAYLLAPFAASGPLAVLNVARAVGAVLWVVAASVLGARIAADESALRWSCALPLAVCAPLAAWSVSGMETGVVIALATLAVLPGRLAPVASAGAVILRPELAPWSVTLAVGRAVAAGAGAPRVFLSGLAGAAPALGVAAARTLLFGSPVPLAVWAKPSDLAHGTFYVLGALLWTGIPVLVAAPFTLRRLGGADRAILVAAGVHLVTLALLGGDWMPFFRLVTPVLPGLALVGARLADFAPAWATVARVVVSTGISTVLLLDKGPDARRVMAQRLALIEQAREPLSGARTVATVDAGWVGVATRADILDLAGVTDLDVARLPGGHTSKAVPRQWLERRRVDAGVLLVQGRVAGRWVDSAWARSVEIRIASSLGDLGFTPRAELQLSGTELRYVVLRLKPGP